jgi:DNA segregation ATPase FtsK/SpoIIIE-like protein
MSSLNFFARERDALVKLVGAIQARAAAETEVAAAFQTASEKAERDINRARKQNAAARETELAAIDAAHAAAAKEISGSHDTAIFALNRGREEKRAAVTQKYKAAQDKAHSEYKDRLWSLDSILEGGEKKAKDQLEQLQRKAATGGERVRELSEESVAPLARCKVTRAAIEYEDPLPPALDSDPITAMNRAIEAIQASLESLKNLFLPKLAGFGGLVVSVLVCAGLGASSFAALDPIPAIATTVGVGVVLGFGLWLLLASLARKQTLRVGRELGKNIAVATAACQNLHDFAKREYDEEMERLVERHQRKKRKTEQYYQPLFAQQKKQYEEELGRIVEEHARATEAETTRYEAEAKAELDGYTAKRSGAVARLDAELHAAEQAYGEKMAAAKAARDKSWGELAGAWNTATTEVGDEFTDLRHAARDLFPDWHNLETLPTTVPAGVRLGELNVDLTALPDAISADSRLAPPATLAGPLPAFAPFPDNCSVVFRTRDEGRAAGVTALQAAMLRFLTGLPPGKVRFTIIDPVGLGDNFASFMHLADFDEKLVTGQIWTEPRQIEARLTDLTDHIASVIQKYLRNQYRTIEDYNQAAGEVAEPYRVLVVANFPTNFTPEAAKRLVSIASSGPSCGVCTLVSVDTKQTMPRDFTMADLEAPSLTLNWRDGKFVPKDPALAPFALTLDEPPEPATIAKLVQRVGQASKDAVRVEVPFDYIAPKPSEYWTASAAKGFDIPVGRAGATRRQVFSLGRGTAQHALIAGKTGSGKSTLLHALITNLGLMYSPDEAELYLVDFKEGVEFQWYATYRLPHARVVAIQSEREFGLSVLQRLDAILRERGEKFRDAGCNDLATYREATPHLKTPRILLVVDEFQMFFVEDDKLAQETALLLDRLVRQGRAFGMHVLLGSQTLGGAYSLARSTIDQMAVRVALQCSDADAQMILSKDNNAARLLSRPGEAIYNDQNGLVEGNDPFQVVWLSEEKREELLKDLGERAHGKWPAPLVFEGNSAADPARNPALDRVLTAKAWPADTRTPLAWLGDPVAIKEPTVAAFRAQGAANLLLLGQNEEAARGLFAAALLGLAGQVKPSDAPTFTVLDGTPDDMDDAEYLRRLAERLPQEAACPNRTDMPAALAALATEIERRQKGEAERTPRFLFVFGLQRFRELRKAEDDFGFGRRGEREVSPAERFAAIIKDGPAQGVHVVVWCDSLTNANRAFDRPLMREFGQRVLFQMSATDSSTLMDSPAASRLGRNRALLLQEDQERPEKFRPYGLPAAEWLESVIDDLRQRTPAIAAMT